VSFVPFGQSAASNQKPATIPRLVHLNPVIPIYGIRDGHYSKEAEPKHTYKKKGTYTSRLTVTNNYDNGKPPATRPKKVVVNEIDTDSKKYCIYRRTKWVCNSKK
jgi:PKD repeat protein